MVGELKCYQMKGLLIWLCGKKRQGRKINKFKRLATLAETRRNPWSRALFTPHLKLSVSSGNWIYNGLVYVLVFAVSTSVSRLHITLLKYLFRTRPRRAPWR